jgi:hypothetical protein
MRGLFQMFIVFILFSCLSFKNHKEDKNLPILKDMLHAKRNFEGSNIRFDGIYTLYDYEDNFVDKFMTFYANGTVLNCTYVFDDSLSTVNWLKNFMHNDNRRESGQVGVFNIYHDTIDIVSYENYGVDNGAVNDFITHFRGIIKNSNAIDLIIVPPYPAVKPLHGMNRTKNYEVINKTYMYAFKPFPAKKYVDSNNFWINKYK